LENAKPAKINAFLERLETKRGRISEALYIKVKDDYLKRLSAMTEPPQDDLPINPALARLLGRLAEVMDEVLLRVYTGEFTNDELVEGIRRLDLFSAINNLITLFNNLESFKVSIYEIAEESMEEPEETSSDLSENPPDIENVLADFDSIDIFADYEEGDEIYDSQYEEEDRWVLNELFLHIMDGYIEPIVVGLRSAIRGQKSTRLFKALLSSLIPLLRSAETMGFAQMSTALARLESILTSAARRGSMNSQLRIATMQAYGELKRQLPDSGKSSGLIDLIDQDSKTSSFLISLTTNADIEEWMVQALLEVGINSPQKLKVASANEISAVTGLSYEKCQSLLTSCRKTVPA